jgi:hypothetical protein
VSIHGKSDGEDVCAFVRAFLAASSRLYRVCTSVRRANTLELLVH